MQTSVIAGALIALAAIIGLSVWTGISEKHSKKKELSTPVAVGLLMGTVVGGSSTIGTAQLAFTYGMSAWWFTLGVGLGCLILTALFYQPVKASGAATLVGVVSDRYGHRAGTTASVLNSLGMFINILSQLLSCSAVVLVIFPDAGVIAIAAGAVVMAFYVGLGGTKGAGVVGILKTVLLYGSMAVCGAIALTRMGGVSGTLDTVSRFTLETGRHYGSLFCRGAGTDLGAGLSLILGMITTQTYMQALLAARSDRDARLSGYISSVLAPLLGIFGILVGLYMRTAVPDPGTFVTRTALTEFILNYSGLPGIVGGICLGTLFLTAVGTGAGLALGISTVIDRQLIAKDRSYTRPLILIVLAAAVITASLPIGDVILRFAFMSMGLRGCTVFVPLCMALWCRRDIKENWVTASIAFSSLLTFVLGVLNMIGAVVLPCDPVFFGVAASLAVMTAGLASGGKRL